MNRKPMTIEDFEKLRREIKGYLRKIKPDALWIENVGKATGPALSLVALDMYGLRRYWYERIPWIGDRWLRQRMHDAWKRPPKQRPAGVPVEVFQREMAEIQGLWRSLWGKLRRSSRAG